MLRFMGSQRVGHDWATELEADLYPRLDQEWGFGVAQGKDLELRHFPKAKTAWPTALEQG